MRHGELAQKALRAALTLRSRHSIRPTDALCPFDLAERLGIEVRFVDIPSLEGMYFERGEPTILVSAGRPPGRQTFTCGHELGHHVFGHTNRIDELVDDRRPLTNDPDEYTADCFSAFLLMPKTAVMSGLHVRGAVPGSPSPETLYRLANWLGVGFSALLTHLRYSLRVVAAGHVDQVLNTPLPAIRRGLAGGDGTSDLIVVDRHWVGRPVDLRLNQQVLMPKTFSDEDSFLDLIRPNGETVLCKPKRPGIGRIADEASAWSAFLRVSRPQYAGRAAFRHLEDPEYGDATDAH